jgi:hypothetical protein
MRINVVLCAPAHFRFTHFLFDTAHALQYGLEALGHHVVLSEGQLDGSRLNVLLNAHTLQDPATISQIVGAKLRYIVHQTEVITGGSVNSTGDKGHFEKVYLPLLRGAVAVWDWSDTHASILQKLGIRARNLRLGAHPALTEVHHKASKDIDLLWYGSVTPHRRVTLTRLVEAGFNVKAAFDPVAFYRNDLIARSRVVLTLQQAVPSHLPYFRIGYLVNNACVVAGEAPPDPHWMDPYYDKWPVEQLPEQLRALLDQGDAALRTLGEDRRARFLEELPIRAELAAALDALDA